MPEFGTAMLGTLPQWGMFAATTALLLLAVIKIIPQIRAQSLESKQQDIEGWREECHKLRSELRSCEEECDRRLKALEDELFGLRRQHLAEQISLINVIIASVDAPELRTMLKTLESVQAHLQLQKAINSEAGQ